MIKVEQLELQRLGGVCARAPVSCLIRQLLNEAGILQPLRIVRVLGLTYGEGRFWLALPQAFVVGFDIRRVEWVRKPQKFFKKPCWAWRNYVNGFSPDVVVIDPPWAEWRRGWDRRGHYIKYNAVGTPEYILKCGIDAAKALRKPLLYHWKAPLIADHIVGPIEFWGRSRLANMRRPSYFGAVRAW